MTRSRPSHSHRAGKTCKRLWVLDADLEAAFDRLGHDHILRRWARFPPGDWSAGG